MHSQRWCSQYQQQTKANLLINDIEMCCTLQDGVLVEWEEQVPLHRYALRLPL